MVLNHKLDEHLTFIVYKVNICMYSGAGSAVGAPCFGKATHCHLRYSLYSNALFCRLRFIASYVVTRLMKDSKGNLNLIGRIGKRILSRH